MDCFIAFYVPTGGHIDPFTEPGDVFLFRREFQADDLIHAYDQAVDATEAEEILIGVTPE